jgi:hypothetical protein
LWFLVTEMCSQQLWIPTWLLFNKLASNSRKLSLYYIYLTHLFISSFIFLLYILLNVTIWTLVDHSYCFYKLFFPAPAKGSYQPVSQKFLLNQSILICRLEKLC